MEEKVDTIQHWISIDKQRLDHIEYGNTVTQEALLALLNNTINKDDIDSVKEAKQRLEKFLIDRERISYFCNIDSSK